MKNQNWYEMSFGAGSWFQVSFMGFSWFFFSFSKFRTGDPGTQYFTLRTTTNQKVRNPINFTLAIYWLSSSKILCSGHFTTLGGYALNCHTCGSPAHNSLAANRYLHNLVWICSGPRIHRKLGYMFRFEYKSVFQVF
jgi:hypothetical protein